MKVFLRREEISRNVANAFKHLGRVGLVHVIILLAHPELVHKYVKLMVLFTFRHGLTCFFLSSTISTQNQLMLSIFLNKSSINNVCYVKSTCNMDISIDIARTKQNYQRKLFLHMT